MANYTNRYRVVMLYGGPSSGPNVISELDFFTGYSHLHVVGSHYDDVTHDSCVDYSGISDKTGVSLYQWGIPAHLLVGDRRPIVTYGEVKHYNPEVGIGSACARPDGTTSGLEREGSYCGAGEALIHGSHSSRVVRGNKLIPVQEDDYYWLMQASDMRGGTSTDAINEFSSRQDLTGQCLAVLDRGDVAFIATFTAEFDETFWARSNGVLPSDVVESQERSFKGPSAVGGHVIGDSSNIGDVATPHNEEAHVRGSVIGNVEIGHIVEVKIAHERDPGTFRMARMKDTVDKAGSDIIDWWSDIITKRRESAMYEVSR